MNNFNTANKLIKEYSEQLLRNIDGFAKQMSTSINDQNLFIDYLWMVSYEFDGFCRAFDSLDYISIYNRFEYKKAFNELLNMKSQEIHKEKNWIFFRFFGD